MKQMKRILTLLMLALMFSLPAAPSMAQTAPPPAAPSTPTASNPFISSENDNCTNIQERKQEIFNGTGEAGLLSEIYNFIKDTLNDATKKLFSAFTNSGSYQMALNAAVTLMVVIGGIGFTIGVIQPSFAQLLVRLLKLGIVYAVVSPGGWTFFSDYAVKFFMDGTDELVKGVVAIGTGVTPPPGATPFYQLDRLASFLIDPDTIIAILGTFTAGGPYGMGMGGLMLIACWGFVSLIIKALRIYAVTFVGRSLLLGVAPVFIVFLLFDRTKQMFVSWVNALISMMLQPVLLFTFLSFFLVLIESGAKDMLSSELCWTEIKAGSQGNANPTAFWRLTGPNKELNTDTMTWNGTLSCLINGKTADNKPCPEFPINIIDILSFLILVYLAQRFSEVIERIANELSNAFVLLDAGGKIDQFISQQASNLTKGPKGK